MIPCRYYYPIIPENSNLIYGDFFPQTMLTAAESKREEEKAKGVETEDSGENPDIVPFEDNEEEEEESDEEDEGPGLARGRGRGMMWPPHMGMVRGARPLMGLRGFPPMMMGPDGFGYGSFFPPFPGPRYPGPMFPGMMMGGAGRAPFMQGMAGPARGGRPVGPPPLMRALPTNPRGSRRDQRWGGSDPGDRPDAGSDHGSKSGSDDEGSKRF